MSFGERFRERMDEVYVLGESFRETLSEHLTVTYPEKPWAVLGLDGGLSTAGLSISVVTESYCELVRSFYLETDSDGTVIERALNMAQQARNIVNGITEIDLIATEKMSYPRSSTSSAKLSAGLTSILTMVNSLIDVPIIEVPPDYAQNLFLESCEIEEVPYKGNVENDKEKVRLKCESEWSEKLPDAKGKRGHIADSIAVAFSSQFIVQ